MIWQREIRLLLISDTGCRNGKGGSHQLSGQEKHAGASELAPQISKHWEAGPVSVPSSWHPLFFREEQDEGPCSFHRAGIQDNKKGKSSSQEPGTKMRGTGKRTSQLGFSGLEEGGRERDGG